MGEKGLGTDPGVVGAGASDVGVVGGMVPGGAIISAVPGAGLPGGGASSAAYARGGVGDASSGARAKGIIRSIPTPPGGGTGGTLDRKPGDADPLGGPGIVGTGAPNPGIVAADLNADGAADRTTADDTWEPGAGVGEAPSEAGGLGGKAGTLTVSGTPGGTAVGRGIGSPTGGSADRGAVKTIEGLEHEHEVVEYHDAEEG
ncbi:MAG: hypothetical protein IVW53_13360 [Chloroflexi bacterium]|nr:hypothetical protein [Chloroflexota bacterium]